MKKNYLSNPSYNYEQVNRASLACGPMVKWAIAQVGSSLICRGLGLICVLLTLTVNLQHKDVYEFAWKFEILLL